jgi:RNA recognition motif-containing protein
MLFVSGLKANTTSTEVREIFKDFPLRDVNIPPGGKTFCFVFVQQAHANSILALFGNGVKWQGRNVRVSLSEKDKRKQKSAFDTVGATTAMPPPTDTTDLKLVNLPYGIADSNIRIIFEGFAVYKVVVKQGYAFVGIATAEVGRAIDQLNDSMVGGRKIKVKVSERRKQ